MTSAPQGSQTFADIIQEHASSIGKTAAELPAASTAGGSFADVIREHAESIGKTAAVLGTQASPASGGPAESFADIIRDHAESIGKTPAVSPSPAAAPVVSDPAHALPAGTPTPTFLSPSEMAAQFPHGVRFQSPGAGDAPNPGGTDPAEAAAFARQAGGVRNPSLREQPTNPLDTLADADRALGEKARVWVRSGQPSALSYAADPLLAPIANSAPAAGLVANTVALPAGIYDIAKAAAKTAVYGAAVVGSAVKGIAAASPDDRASADEQGRQFSREYLDTINGIGSGLANANPALAVKAIAGDSDAGKQFAAEWQRDPGNALMDWVAAGGTLHGLGKMPLREDAPSLADAVKSIKSRAPALASASGATPADITLPEAAPDLGSILATTRPGRKAPALAPVGSQEVAPLEQASPPAPPSGKATLEAPTAPAAGASFLPAEAEPSSPVRTGSPIKQYTDALKEHGLAAALSDPKAQVEIAGFESNLKPAIQAAAWNDTFRLKPGDEGYRQPPADFAVGPPKQSTSDIVAGAPLGAPPGADVLIPRQTSPPAESQETSAAPPEPVEGVPFGHRGQPISADEFRATVDAAGQGGSIAVDDYARARGIPVRAASSELTIAELSGVAERLPGNRFRPPGGSAPAEAVPEPLPAPKKGKAPKGAAPVALAPMTAAETGPMQPAPPAIGPTVTGNAGVAYTAGDRAVPFHYGVMEAGDLLTSHTPTFDVNSHFEADLQPRDRTRGASIEQVTDLAQSLNPDRLAENPGTSDGAPIVGPDRMVESGNARTMALRMAYAAENGRGGGRASVYRAYVLDNAQRLGIDPEAVRSMRDPVLVRLRDASSNADIPRPQLAEEMGSPAVAAMSEPEVARNDGAMLRRTGIIGMATPDAGGRVTNSANQPFVQAFMDQVPAAERPTFQQADRQLTNAGARRIRNGIIAAAYDDPGILERMVDDPDDNVRTVGNAIVATAPKFAQIRAAIDRGHLRDLDITADISAAANLLSHLRDVGTGLEEHLQQTNIFGEEASPVVRSLARMFEQYKRSATKITQVLDTYADGARLSGDVSTTSLFGDSPPTPADILEAADTKVRSHYETASAAQTALDIGPDIKPSQRPGDSGSDGPAREPGAGPPDANTLFEQSAGYHPEAGNIIPIPEDAKPPALGATGIGDPAHGAGPRLDAAADAAAKRIMYRNKGRTNTFVDPADVSDAAIWVGAKLVRGLVNASTFGAQVLGSLGRHLQPALGRIWSQAKDVANRFITDEVGGIPREKIDELIHVFQGGRYRDAYRLDKGTGDALNSLAAASESAQTRAHYQANWVLQGLSQAQKDDMMTYLKDLRRRSLEASGWTPGPGLPVMSAADRARVTADPDIARALARHQSGPQADIEALRTYVSPRMPLTHVDGDHFLSLLPTKDKTGKPVATGTGPGRSIAAQQRMSGTRFAKTATGSGQEYSHDYAEVLKTSYTEVMRKARLKDLYHTIVRARDAKGAALAVTNMFGKQIPAEMEYNGKMYPTRTVETQLLRNPHTSQPYMIKIGIPEPLYGPIADATIHSPDLVGAEGLLRKAQGFATALQLLTPREMVQHVNRLTGIAGSLPPTTTAGRLEALAPHLGPRLGFLYRAFNTDMALPENYHVLEQIMDANGGSSRPFHADIEKGIVSKIPIAGHLSSVTHDALFGLPEGKASLPRMVKALFRPGTNAGFGFDLRLRVIAEKIRRQVEGNEDPQRIREFANQFGQYTHHPDALISGLKKTGLFSPYLATSLPVQLTEFKQLVGDAGFKGLTKSQRIQMQAETLFRGVGGSIIAAMVVNHMMSGHWPWQNEDGHKTDIEIGKDGDGSPIYATGTALAPSVARPLRTAGLLDDYNDWRSGNASGAQVAINSGRGATNAALSVAASPLANVGFAATTGKAPYVTRGLDFLRIADNGTTPEVKLRNNLRAALSITNPIASGLSREGSLQAQPADDRRWRTFQNIANSLSSRAVTK